MEDRRIIKPFRNLTKQNPSRIASPYGVIFIFVFVVASVAVAQSDGSDEPVATTEEQVTPDGEPSLDVTSEEEEYISDEDIDLLSMDVVNVMDMVVMSGRSEDQNQKLFDIPAALTVITNEEIRRSGLRTLPEILRLVPGLHVARMDANRWAIGARGFSGRLNYYQLVQIDGRNVYNTILGGTYWIIPDLVQEDIDRIEVLRGPGASLWGANAVNGIVNIITKKAKDTQGGLISGVFGSDWLADDSIRYGGELDEETYFRVYAKHRQHDDFATYNRPYSDDFRSTQSGFRIDWEGFEKDTFTLQGDVFCTPAGSSVKSFDTVLVRDLDLNSNDRYSGGNILGRWDHTFSDTSHSQLKLYYDRVNVEWPDDSVQRSDIVDLDWQHNFVATDWLSVIWGLGYRANGIDIANGDLARSTVTKMCANTFSGFIQGTFTLVPDKLDLTLGTKAEHNDFTGFEIQPNFKLAWTPHENHMFWGGISRAVRVPAFSQYYIDLNFAAVAPLTTVRILGDDSIPAEELISYELGYRFRSSPQNPRVTLDISTFFNRYENYLGLVPRNQIFLVADDRGVLESHGIEVAVNWQVTDGWKLSANYSWFDIYQHMNGAVDTVRGLTPTNQFAFHSYLDITKDLEFNTSLYYYDNLPASGIPSYTRLDTGFTWRPTDYLELSLVGQNLLDNRHPEYGPDGFISNGVAEVRSSVYAQVVVRF